MLLGVLFSQILGTLISVLAIENLNFWSMWFADQDCQSSTGNSVYIELLLRMHACRNILHSEIWVFEDRCLSEDWCLNDAIDYIISKYLKLHLKLIFFQ